MNITFTKPTGKSLTSSWQRHKKQGKEEKNENKPSNIWAMYVLSAYKMQIKRYFMPTGQRMKNFVSNEFKREFVLIDRDDTKSNE